MPTGVVSNSNTAKVSFAPGGYYAVKAADWGILAPGTNNGEGTWGNGNLSAAGTGTLSNSTIHVKMTYTTADGESLPSADATITLSGGTSVQAVTVTLPTVPPPNATGWNVYSATSATTLLNNTTPIAIATTTYIITAVGAGVGVPTIGTAGVQLALPRVTTASTVDGFVLASRVFRANREVQWSRPYAVVDPAGVSLSAVDCIAPLWIASATITSIYGVAATGSWCVLNGVLFGCTTAGQVGATVPTFNYTVGGTTTDNAATWTCLGYRSLLRLRFTNSSGTTAQPVPQEYDFIQP